MVGNLDEWLENVIIKIFSPIFHEILEKQIVKNSTVYK
jgi:hypothetical protein